MFKVLLFCQLFDLHAAHYNDVTMSTMASQSTSLTIVNSTVYSKKTSKLRVTGLCEGNSPVTGEFPAQRASNAKNVSIWWRHHGQEINMIFIGMLHLLPSDITKWFRSRKHGAMLERNIVRYHKWNMVPGNLIVQHYIISNTFIHTVCS